MTHRFTLAALSVLLLTACGSLSPAESAGKAMGETACLLFDDPSTTTSDELSQKTDDIMKKYGFEKASDIDAYLTAIQGTEELNTVKTTTRDTLTAECGDTLTEKEVDPADLAEAMVTQ